MLLLNKILYIVFILCLAKNKLTASLYWNEENKLQEVGDKDNLRTNKCPEELEEYCKKDAELYNSLSKKLKTGILPIGGKSKRLSQFLETLSGSSCNCKINLRLMDLGADVYPRYVQTGLCKKNSCGMFERCQPKKYQLKVIKRRNPQTDEVDSMLLQEAAFPESLQEEWVPEYVSVVVGCTCIPKKGYNNEIAARMSE
ncbi:prothoracicotropic hormone-like [Rhynchophorus ferrugineus]|uniref:prothoracicotropic hormone-like n=1 Tax=Rhynchophorus ferrugineus TaxID=354439 RepID=UPI003FCDAC53